MGEVLWRKEWKRNERDRMFKINLQGENIAGFEAIGIWKVGLNVVQVLKRLGSGLGVEKYFLK